MELLKELFVKNLDNTKLDEETRKLSRFCFEFLNSEKEFFDTMNEDDFNAEKSILLGRKINVLRDEISKKIDFRIQNYSSLSQKISTFKDKLYVLGIELLALNNKIPRNILSGLLQKRSSLQWVSEDTSVKEMFERDYYSFEIWEAIYSDSGIDGIARYTVLNNKFIDNLGETLLDVHFNKELSKEVILNLTSKETVLYDLKSVDQINVIDYAISFETGDEILKYDSPKKVIEL